MDYFRYDGIVHRSGEGLYRAEYSGAGGQPQRMLATQLEAIYARTLFPGFDEPAFRANLAGMLERTRKA